MALPYFCVNEEKSTLYQCFDGIDNIVRNILSVVSYYGAFGETVF